MNHQTLRHVRDRIKKMRVSLYDVPDQWYIIAKRACIRRDILYVQARREFRILKAGLHQFVSLKF